MGFLGKIKASPLFQKRKRAEDLEHLTLACDSFDIDLDAHDSFEELLGRVPLQPLHKVASCNDHDDTDEGAKQYETPTLELTQRFAADVEQSISNEENDALTLNTQVKKLSSTTPTKVRVQTFPHLHEMAFSEVSQEVIASFPKRVEFEVYPELEDYPDPDLAIYLSSSDSSCCDSDDEVESGVVGLVVDTSFQQILTEQEPPLLSPSYPEISHVPPTQLHRRVGAMQNDCLGHIFHEELAPVFESDEDDDNEVLSPRDELDERNDTNAKRADDINVRARWEYALRDRKSVV